MEVVPSIQPIYISTSLQVEIPKCKIKSKANLHEFKILKFKCKLL
jgi:hypothetical protein